MMPKETAEKGRQIYKDELRTRLEPEHNGRYVVIDVNTHEYYLADTSDEAVDLAQAANPDGAFYLIRVGFPGAYQLSSLICGSLDRNI